MSGVIGIRLVQGMLTFSLTLLMLSACGGSTSGGSRAAGVTRLSLVIATPEQRISRRTLGVTPGVQTRQVMPGDPGYVTRLLVRVEAIDLTPPILRQFDLGEANQQTFTGQFEVPIGADRTIIVKGLNGEGVSIFQGQVQVNLMGGAANCETLQEPVPATDLICRVPVVLARDQLIPLPAALTDIDEFTFSFPDGLAFGLVDTPIMLTIGAIDSAGDSAPFDLVAKGASASGTVRPGSCLFDIALSTIPAGQGPQVGEQLRLDPCNVDAVDGRLLVTNSISGATATSTLPVELENRPPILLNPGPQVATEGVAVDLQLSASDSDGDTFSLSAVGLPPGLSLVASTGQIIGAPNDQASGQSPYLTTLFITDGTVTTSVMFTWTVRRAVWGAFLWGDAQWGK